MDIWFKKGGRIAMKNKKILLERKSTIICAMLVTLIPVLIGLYYYDKLPEKMALHFSLDGKADSYMNKFSGIFISPIFLAIVEIVIFEISKISTKQGKKVNIKGVHFMIWIIAILSFVINILTISVNLGINFDVTKIVGMLCGGILAVIGNYMPKESIMSKDSMNLPKALKGRKYEVSNIMGKTFVVLGLLSLVVAFFSGKIAVYTLLIVPVLVIFELIYLIIRYKNERE